MTCSPLYHRTSEKRSEFTKLVLASQFPKVPEGTRVDACAVLLMNLDRVMSVGFHSRRKTCFDQLMLTVVEVL